MLYKNDLYLVVFMTTLLHFELRLLDVEVLLLFDGRV
jgi:hypothetical protein